MNKISHIDGHNFVKIVNGWGETKYGQNMAWIDTSSRFSLEKIAKANGVSETYIPPKLREKIAELQGTLPKDKVAFYNRALGTAQSYGLNMNGDQWQRHELMAKHATFVTNARYYKSHKNKADVDPHYGVPIDSSFNEKTDMVDLIILADFNKQAEEDIQTLEGGGSVWTSMGCRVKHDICTICGNKAPNRNHYCEHVKEGAAPPYGMRAILPDGSICGVDNPDPVFFDISRVQNPAFKGSENLLKVASSIINIREPIIVVSSAKIAEDMGLMPKTAEGQCGSVVSSKSDKAVKSVKSTKAEKSANGLKKVADKLADMIKEVPGVIDGAIAPDSSKLESMAPAVEGHCCCSKKIPKKKLKEMSKKAGIDAVLSTATSLGLILSPDEFSDLTDLPYGIRISSEEILNTPASKTASDIISRPPNQYVEGELWPYAKERSLLQPILTGSLPWSVSAFSKMSSTRKGLFEEFAHNKVASNAYLLYRQAVLAGLSQTTDSHGSDVLATKLAETSARYVTPSSSAFALLAFCHNGYENEPMREQLLAKVSSVADNSCETLHVSGSMADYFGRDVIEAMADNFLQR